MSDEKQNQQPTPAPGNQQTADQSDQSGLSRQQAQADTHPNHDGLANKKPEELTPEELRLMADTMPGEGPGD